MKDPNCGYCMGGDILAGFGIKICDLQVSQLILFKEQSHPGRVIVAYKEHVSELVDISDAERNLFFADVAQAARAIHKAFHPDKINYGAYGDGGCHLHFHLVPKYKGQYEWGTPFAMNPGITKLSHAEYAEMIQKIKDNLEKRKTAPAESAGAVHALCFLGHALDGQADAVALFLHLQHHDLDDIPHLQHLAGVLHPAVCHLGNVDQAVLVNADVHKYAEVDDIAHGAQEHHAGLQILDVQHILAQNGLLQLLPWVPTGLLQLSGNVQQGGLAHTTISSQPGDPQFFHLRRQVL